jgi:hypothetical protein
MNLIASRHRAAWTAATFLAAWTLARNVSLLSLETRQHPAWLGRAFVALFAALVLYTLVFSPEASMSRAALLVIR